MLTPSNIETILYALTIYQLLFFTIQLVSFKKSNPARKYLGILLMGMTIFTVLNALFYTGALSIMVWLYFFYIPLLLALPPLFLLYIVSLFRKNAEVGLISRFVLFIPAFLFLILNIFTFGLSPLQEKLLFLAGNHSITGNVLSEINYFLVILWFGLIIIAPVQLLLAVIRIRTVIQSVSLHFPPHLAYIQSNWVYIISFSLLVYFSTVVMQILFVDTNTLLTSVVFNSIVLISTGLAGYYTMKQDDLFTQVARVGSLKQEVDNTHIDPETKPGHNMPVEEASEIIEKIRRLMEVEKPYLIKNYGINDLSRQTGVRRHNLTLVLNEVMDTNFNGFINDYRIREAIHMLKSDTQNNTIDAIAEMAGFHTRSSFYACFKKYTGKTPKEFLMERARGSNGVMDGMG